MFGKPNGKRMAEGKTVLPGNVEAKVAECFPMDWGWVTGERQAGFIGFCL